MKQNKQTAVEFLKEQLNKILIDNQIQQTRHLFEQTLELEKKQIIAAVEWNYKSNMGEVYYNAVYKNNDDA
jgi:hypothetical protein